MIVIDANVAVKWHVPEKGERLADSILRSEDVLVAPSCIGNEVLSAIVRSVNENRSTPEKAELHCKQWIEQLSDRVVMTFSDEELVSTAVSLGVKHGHYFIDCLYLALCQKMNATLLTFDVPLSKVAKREGIECDLLDESSEPSIPA